MAGLNAELAAPINGIPGSDATTNPEAFYRYAQSLPNQLPSLPQYHVAQYNGLPHFPPYNQGLPQIPRYPYAPRPIAVTHDDVYTSTIPQLAGKLPVGERCGAVFAVIPDGTVGNAVIHYIAPHGTAEETANGSGGIARICMYMLRDWS